MEKNGETEGKMSIKEEYNRNKKAYTLGNKPHRNYTIKISRNRMGSSGQ